MKTHPEVVYCTLHVAILPILYAAGDWLQGPYVYRLYEYYGYEVGDIGRLFIAGFGSSMVFGTIAGSLADKQCVTPCLPVPSFSNCTA